MTDELAKTELTEEEALGVVKAAWAEWRVAEETVWEATNKLKAKEAAAWAAEARLVEQFGRR